MVKLFAMEDDTGPNNELIIDKLIEKTKAPKSPLSLTADLLKQRQEITKEVKVELDKSDDAPDDIKPEEETTEEPEGDDEDKEPEEQEEEDKPEDEKEEKEDKEPVDDEDAADNKDDLTSLVGSGLSGNDKKEDKPKEDKKEEVAEESFKPKVTLRNIFQPLLNHHQSYSVSLEAYGLEDNAVPVDKQPIVYVKEAIQECIANLTKVSYSYIDNTTSFVTTTSAAVLKLNETFTVFTNLVDSKKYHFTNKLVKDKDILENVSYVGHSDLRETSRSMLKYLEQANLAVSLMLSNPFDQMRDAFTSKAFVQEDTDVMYSKPVPGFTVIKVAMVPYSNYLKTKLENFQYYKLRTVKAEDLYSLSAISITEDNDLEYIVKTVNDLIASVSIDVDTLKLVVGHFTKFTDELKVLSYNVEQDQYTNLTELGIDDKVKDFIKFKLAMEASFININLTLDYITSVASALNICLELSE